MERTYQHLSPEERAVILLMRSEGKGPRAIGRVLHRDPGTISRELKRYTLADKSYDARRAGLRAHRLRRKRRRTPKLAPQSALFDLVAAGLELAWSPAQIAGLLKVFHPHDRTRTVSHETIYTALYAMPLGQLRTDLLANLRQGHKARRPRSQGQDRRGQIPDMVSIHVRPPDVEDRLVPGHWEGDLIKGAGNRSAVGTLVERSSRLVLLVKLDASTAEAALEGFSRAFERIPRGLRQTLTYDQGKEMACHKALGERTGLKIYFADPHSPWQRGSNENTNGLIRQFLPKDIDLSQYSQEQLDAFEWMLNTRPRKVHGFKCPLEVYASYEKNLAESESQATPPPVALAP
jgi:IS30 family transposase